MIKSSKPLVSVLVTTYFRNELLERALESVQSQTHSPVETFVIDGSEVEHAKPVVKQFDEVSYLAPTPDPGFHAGRQIAFDRAKGGLIQFLDDDDYLHPEKFERQLPLFDGDTGVVYCGLEASTGKWAVSPNPEVRGDVLNHALAFDTHPASPATLLMDRTILGSSDAFDHPDGADDEGTQIELAQRTNYDFVDAPLALVGDEMEDTYSETWEYAKGLAYLLDYYSELYIGAPPWVGHRAHELLYRNRAARLSDDYLWSPRMIRAYALSAYYARDNQPKRWAMAVASVFGRPGLSLAQQVYQTVR